MAEEKESTFEEEFRRLGENLKENIEGMWNEPKNQEFREEIKSGLVHLGDTLNGLIDDFSESPTGQRFQDDVEDFGERLRSGEVEAKIRQDAIKVLDMMNIELEKVKKNWGKSSETEMTEESEEGESG
jgi:hypothetical protein